MSFIVKYRPGSAKWIKAYTLIVAGALIIASGYVFFITPHKIVPGGIYGISIVLHHTFGTPVGLTALFFNIPLTLIGIRVLGPRAWDKTFTGFILTSLFIDGLTLWYGHAPLIQDDILLSSLFGGIVIGIGVGLLFKAKASCGGTDVMAMMLGKWTGKPLGQLMMMVDALIVVGGSIVFVDWAIPMYSLVAIFAMGKLIDLTLQGFHYDKVVLIVSSHYEQIAHKIIHDMNRGGTYLKAQGMFAYENKQLIYVVLNRREIGLLKEHIQLIDPKAFVTVLDADEILGQGFRSLSERVSD